MKELQNHPLFSKAHLICQTLIQHGHLAYLAGGCVRDLLLGRTPHDLDIATSATPDEVESLFPRTVPIGKKFGVILVVMDGDSFEVTTFRSDALYVDGRRPTEIRYSTPEEDSKRRDFTMNALFYDTDKQEVIDFVNGVQDIKNRIIQTVGQPEERFDEDYLRMLRAVRFSAQLGFDIDEKTFHAVQEKAPKIKQLSAERIREELEKLLCADFFHKKIAILIDSHILQNIFNLKDWKIENYPNVTDARLPKNKAEWRWIQFWHWYFLNGGQDIQAEILKLKFSTAQKRSILHGLKILEESFEHENAEQVSLGERIYLLFEEGSYWGAIMLSKLYPKHTALNQILTALQKIEELNHVKPEPLVRGTDMPWLKSEELGAALKKLYFLQLEGVVKTKSEALEFYRKQRS